MNVMTPPPHGYDPRDLDDIVISRAELDRIALDRRLERRAQARRRFWRDAGITGVVAAQFGIIFSLMAFIWVRPSQTTPVPIIVYQKPDGRVVNYAEWESLPMQVRNDTTLNVVWNYIEQRESWSEGNAGHAWTVVSALSAPKIREQFQNWYRKENPESPARQYADGTTVSAQYVNWAPVCPIDGCNGLPPPAYRFWFDRYEDFPGNPAKLIGHYAVTVRIKRNVPLPMDRLWQRWTFNAPLIQVVEYPQPSQEGVPR